ncbi:MAG: hypothetical protein ACE5HN_07500 [Nitrospiria bacterium]
MERLQATLEGLKYNISRLQVRVLALEGRKNVQAFEEAVHMTEADALFWSRLNRAKVEFNGEGVSILVGPEDPQRTFCGKNLVEAVEEAKEFVAASVPDRNLTENGLAYP